MTKAPWLTIIGMGEDGRDGLSPTAQSALDAAEVIMAPPRHLSLVGEVSVETQPWPVPYADGIAQLLALKGRRVVVLASGDPFWFGAGNSLSRHLEPGEWTCLPGLSTFTIAANRMGWPLETTSCLGLHAAPLPRMRSHLAPGTKLLVYLRDGGSVHELGAYLTEKEFGTSQLTIMQALGGPREKIVTCAAHDAGQHSFAHPICVACEIAGDGAVLPHAAGRGDDWFDNDGQITKRPIRAMTLSALAPRPFEHLWDIGGGSGSIAIEWLLSHSSVQATCIEANAERAARITANAAKLGVDRLSVVTGKASGALKDLPKPDVVFIGGGLSKALLADLETRLDNGTRLVANAVTLESEAVLLQAHARLGGDLLRLELSRAEPLGPKRGWKASYPIVQWSVTL